RIAAAVADGGVRVGAAFTGRCNVYATAPGLLLVDEHALDAVNAVDEAITVASLAPYARVEAEQLLATVKIIPFAVPGERLQAALDGLAAADPVLRVAPFRALDVALLQTTLPDTRAAVLDKTARVLAERLERLGSRLVRELRCAHREDEIARAVDETLTPGIDLLLVAGASAIVDRRDVVPAGIVRAGGELRHFGMPVDPGNLLLLARRGTVPVLGLPGCARSPKFNGFDQVLERIAADIPVAPRDVMSLGVGGLLKEVGERGQARSPRASPARAPRVAALVLAAGQSTRMGPANKLLADIAGVPMVARVADTALAAGAAGVFVVTGHERELIEQALGERPVSFVHNPDYAEGLSSSLARGIAALPADVDGVLVCLGDMPRITVSHLERLMAAFDPGEGRAVCVPMHEGRRGHPVLWGRQFFDEIRAIRGDVGARHLLGEHAELVCEVAVDDDGVLVDVDSPDSLEALRASR
ncbi:MAG: molybdopterin-binding/glycosyltransferase family 2 protein, partial [Gammaproteobacteria bacterium]|nr:molybdopterin-binding/glycosyltransferase family 2 protein [Gammaproteobacteria bacterium]